MNIYIESNIKKCINLILIIVLCFIISSCKRQHLSLDNIEDNKYELDKFELK